MAAMVEHGDVLLFKNERTIAAIQRFITSSEYGSWEVSNQIMLAFLLDRMTGK